MTEGSLINFMGLYAASFSIQAPQKVVSLAKLYKARLYIFGLVWHVGEKEC